MAFYIYLDFRKQDFLSQIISKNLILRDFLLQFLHTTNWPHLFKEVGGHTLMKIFLKILTRFLEAFS